MRKLLIATALIIASFAAAPTLAQSTHDRSSTLSSAEEATYEFALELFREQRYAGAYGRFMRLADAGHLPSAQLVLAMYENGPALFASDWDASTEQLDRWTTLIVLEDSDLRSVALAK